MKSGISGDRTDLALLEILQEELPLVPRPYETVARQLGISEDETIGRITRLLGKGIIRSISPLLEPGRIGNNASTLVALHVPENRIREIVPVINGYSEVSHNFRRDNHYSVWFTISAPDRQRIERILTDIRNIAGISEDDFIELPTVRKFKVDVRFRLTGTEGTMGRADERG